MDSPGSHILPRDPESGTNSDLTAGAIAGIACGAGALFLGAAGLFIIYWRRQRQYDREDNGDGDSFVQARSQRGPMGPALTYTMDYKMDDPQHHEGDHGSSSYTYSPEKPSSAFSPLGAPDTASAMPTHPAYIPRALVRGSITPSNRSTATTSPPPFPSPPFPVAVTNPKTQADDTVIQAYFAAAAAQRTTSAAHSSQTQETLNHPPGGESDSSSIPSLPAQPRPRQKNTRQPPAQIPTLVIPPIPDTTALHTLPGQPQLQGRKPRSYPPPRLNLNLAEGTTTQPRTGDKPLLGKENTTISGPLAFPQHYHHPGLGPLPGGGPSSSGWTRAADDAGDEDDYLFYGEDNSQSDSRRTFRSRALAGSDDHSKGKKHGRKRSDRNSGGGAGGGAGAGGGGAGTAGNRHYAEIEIGRGSDIW